MKDIYAVLDDLSIVYTRYDHPAVFTVKEAESFHKTLPGGQSKNLFLRGDNKVRYLVVMDAFKRLDIKALSATLGTKLHFASPEELQARLGLTPGSVSPFGLINDTEKGIRVILDLHLMTSEKMHFHPNINTATLEISTNDFMKFLAHQGNPLQILDL